MHTEIKKNKRCYSGNKAQDPQTVINWKLVKRLIKEGKINGNEVRECLAYQSR